MVKIVIAGNATIDAIVHGKAKKISRDMIEVSSEDVRERFRIEDPPIKSGYKHRVNQNIVQKVEALWHRMQPGGGGYNSGTAIRNLPDIGSELELHYVDVSIPHHLIEKGLRKSEITSHFFFERDVPVNAIISFDGDRVIFKGYQLGRVEPDESKIRDIRRIIKDSDSLLVSGVKDTLYLESYIATAKQYNVPVYAVVGTSLDKEFLIKTVLPNSNNILNYDEIPWIHGITEEMDEKSRMELALDTIRQIRSDINHLMPIYATLGKNGAYCASKDLIWHVHLTQEYAEKVAQSIASQPRRVNGAGDNFAGALVAYDTWENHKLSLKDILVKASTVAIRHIGYTDSLPQGAFIATELPMGRYNNPKPFLKTA
jgi:sugar/nucleoside kinase (ribokinase family)